MEPTAFVFHLFEAARFYMAFCTAMAESIRIRSKGDVPLLTFHVKRGCERQPMRYPSELLFASSPPRKLKAIKITPIQDADLFRSTLQTEFVGLLSHIDYSRTAVPT